MMMMMVMIMMTMMMYVLAGVIGASGTRPVRFRVVRDNMLRISIVMDVSGSMNDYVII